MAKINVVMTTVGYEREYLEKMFSSIAPAEVIHVRNDDDAGIASALKRADVAILASDLDERYLKAPKLRWVHCDHAGLNKSAKPEVFDQGLIVTSSAGRSAPALAEHAMFFMLALAYQFPKFYQAQTSRQWGFQGQSELSALYGRTVAILGMGNTGKEVAFRAKAFSMQVLGYSRRLLTPAPVGVDHMYSAESKTALEEILTKSDVVVLSLPLTDATFHLIGQIELEKMKPSAILVNMARGAVVDEQALVHALRSGQIAGAGLDTFAQEPLPEDSPLWDAPNTLITPHFTPPVPDRTERSLQMICENIRRYREDQPMINRLKPEDVFSGG